MLKITLYRKIFQRTLKFFELLIEIIMQINSGVYVKSDNWEIIHPLILKASKGLYDDGHYANAAENALKNLLPLTYFRVVNCFIYLIHKRARKH